MSFSITLFGRKHYWWTAFKNHPRAWFIKPDESSTGGAGFCLPGLHIVFTWGAR